MGGHLIRAMGMPYFPFNDYRKNRDQLPTSVTLLDCIDKRMLEAFSAKLNFTYEFSSPPDNQFGISTASGNWTGLVGAIQRNIADITTMIAPSPGRNQIFDHMRGYAVDPMAIVSPKPQLLSYYLLIFRPFSKEVWLFLVLSIAVCGVVMWCLEKVSSLFKTTPRKDLSTAFLYSWSVILQEPSDKTPPNTSGQMLFGWWLVVCIVITTGYTSSLVAHLTVQSRTKPVDSWDDLPKLTNWKWGLEESLFRAAPLLYFKSSKDPTMMHIYKYLESISVEDGMKRILKGRYSLLLQTSRISMIIASYYTDDFGRTPYYIGKKGQPVTSDFGWGIRKGAPYRNVLQNLMNRFLDNGITNYWYDAVSISRVRQNRREATPEQQIWRQEDIVQQQLNLQEEGPKSLEIKHMMGVFFSLFLGFLMSFLTFLGENLFKNYSR
ncbi:hypothetical protein SK128_020471 [Halocaridina rubra]|uniref:Ionotropic glutamate receptor L-glutamate and glycine-binding domain-containing protein n=1 Tax=Halocaridina rubra TaxID=373956 RepID=A0AAN8WHZ3_HALRR